MSRQRNCSVPSQLRAKMHKKSEYTTLYLLSSAFAFFSLKSFPSPLFSQLIPFFSAFPFGFVIFRLDDQSRNRNRVMVFINGYHYHICTVDHLPDTVTTFYICVHTYFHRSSSHIRNLSPKNYYIIYSSSLFKIQVIDNILLSSFTQIIAVLFFINCR